MKALFRGIILCALCLGTSLGVAQPMVEFRGLYVDAFHPGIKTHEQVTQMVQAAKAANFNALIVQVRKRGDAYYNSTIEPRAADIAADYDPLADVLSQAHAAGLEVHAWVSVYSIVREGSENAPTHVYVRHPEWIAKDRDGKSSSDAGTLYTDPGIPEARDYTVSVIADIAKNYEVDGIHLDHVRYLSRESGYGGVSVSLFNDQNGKTGEPAYNDESWCAWRRQQITDLIRKAKAAVSANRPQARLSASVLAPNGSFAAEFFLQDWATWCREGLVDFIVPMVYIKTDTMAMSAQGAVTVDWDRHVYAGIGAYQISSDLACKQIQDSRALGAKGVVLYNYHYLGPNSGSTGYAKLADLTSTAFAEPSSVPSMPWRAAP